jgi:hypothetical protein
MIKRWLLHIRDRHAARSRSPAGVLVGLIVIGAIVTLGGYFVFWKGAGQFGKPESDEEGLYAIKQEARVVANSLGSSLDGGMVTRDSCTDHKFTRVCYFDATLDSRFSNATELRKHANDKGWDSNGTNMEYEYCHSLLRIEDTHDGPKLKIHCYVSID